MSLRLCLMPLSAQQLYDAAQLEPADFGSVVDPGADEATQLQQALAYLDSDAEDKTSILKTSFAEVSLAVRRALGDFSTPLDYFGLTDIFGRMAGEVIALWDGAQTSFGRSELNKRVDSNSKSYDEDSDQDRIQGNQRRQQLVDFIADWRASQVVAVEAVPTACSGSVPILSTW